MLSDTDKSRCDLVGSEWVRKNLLPREKTANKGSFGKALLIVGSDKYRGAAHLAVSMALRGGAGYISYLGKKSLSSELRVSFPEVIYHTCSLKDTEKILSLQDTQNAVLIGSGSGVSKALYSLLSALITRSGGILVIDADGLNSIAKYAPSVEDFFKPAKRRVVITPHPLEFSRLTGLSVEEIEADRCGVASRFARLYGVVVLLKGYGTVITDGDRIFVNTTGSSALAKAGSGDVLAGLLASVSAYTADPLFAAGISAYLHGAAGDSLSKDFTEYGVTPSDLPKEVCKILGEILKSE